MILGAWWGKTPAALGTKIDKIRTALAKAEAKAAVKLETVSTHIDQAVADRTAAISELKADVESLLALKGKL